ncbi:MAG: hypothetical protein LUQ22_07840 [Methanotrichaceae archaeon]|nr:hypothetical protein [Methanotrichaceae archaeon]
MPRSDCSTVALVKTDQMSMRDQEIFSRVPEIIRVLLPVERDTIFASESVARESVARNLEDLNSRINDRIRINRLNRGVLGD